MERWIQNIKCHYALLDWVYSNLPADMARRGVPSLFQNMDSCLTMQGSDIGGQHLPKVEGDDQWISLFASKLPLVNNTMGESSVSTMCMSLAKLDRTQIFSNQHRQDKVYSTKRGQILFERFSRQFSSVTQWRILGGLKGSQHLGTLVHLLRNIFKNIFNIQIS